MVRATSAHPQAGGPEWVRERDIVGARVEGLERLWIPGDEQTKRGVVTLDGLVEIVQRGHVAPMTSRPSDFDAIAGTVGRATTQASPFSRQGSRPSTSR